MRTEPVRRRWRRIAGLVLLAALGLGLQMGCATLDERQRGWIFQPGDRTWAGGVAAAEGMDDVWIPFQSRLDESRGADVRLHGLWLPQADPNAPVLLYLHGARYDVRGSAPRMRRMHELGFAVLGVDYRGFGRSSAALPSEALAAEDARAAWDWLARQHPGQRRFIFGHSLGGAIAVHLASDIDDEAGLIVEGGFTSIPDVVSTFRWGWLPLSPLITQRFDAASRIAEVGSPLLVVHGSQDSLIPARLAEQLYERAREPKRFVLVDGGSHHSTNAVGHAQYREALGDLFGLRSARLQ
ncbi:MAG: alpha/beta fold hydrolase [Rubrivivax sp.]|nr:MAG: alpha/beta fold hydrolase [Rubrivivax sp.]